MFPLPLDEPEKYTGAPISLQLVGRRYEDERVRRVLFISSRVRLIKHDTY